MKTSGHSTFTNTAAVRRYGAALVSTALALWISGLMTPAVDARFSFATLLFAVMFSAWYGGYGPAVTAVLLAAFWSAVLLVRSPELRLVGSDDPVGLILFVLVGAGIVLLGGMMHTAKLQARGTAPTSFDQLEVMQSDRTEIARDENHADKTAMLESALDCIITMDHRGRIVEFNPAAERTFGYSRPQAIGQLVGELLVPPHLRDSHYRGLAHYLKTGEGPVLQRRIEIEAMRADTSQFPVELAITRIAKAGPPLFTAYLRDISKVKAAERRRNARLNISQILARTTTVGDAAPAVLEAICNSLDWEMGALWTVDREANVLRCVEAWHRKTPDLNRFDSVSRQTTMAPGIGLPGRIWTSKASAWISDVTVDRNFPRASSAAEAGLHGAFGFPLMSEGNVIGVIEFFSKELREPDEHLLEMMVSVGSQIGHVIERRRAEELLHEAEERTAAVVNHVIDGIIIIDERGTVEMINPAVHKLFGYAPEEVVGHNVKLLMPEPYHSEHDEYIARYLQTGVGKVIGIGRDVQGRRKDGTTFPLELAISEFRHDARRFFTGIVRDISQRKKAEDSLRFLVDASGTLASLMDETSTLQKLARLSVPFLADCCMVFLVQEDHKIERVAAAHVDPSKEGLLNELLGRYALTWDSPTRTGNVLRTGKPVLIPVVDEALLQSISRDERHLALLHELNPRSYIFVPLITRTKVIGAIGLVSAESDRRFSAAELAVAEELGRRAAVAIENARLYTELREADRRKDEFLAMLAHELRNPLAPIRNALELLNSDVDRDTAEWAKALMQRQVRHIVRLVDDLLDVSRIMRGKIQLKKEPVELSSAIHDALEEARPAIALQGQEFTLLLPPQPIWVQADPVRLSQIISNLLNNAAKYTDKGGRISLGVTSENGHVTIAVRDSGIGIAPNMLARIFVPFTQVAHTPDRSRGGLGIGLALVRSLVEMHDGTVSAYSEGLGKGSEFVVRLPIIGHRYTHDRVDWQPSPVPARRVLIVDDNHSAAESLGRLLSKLWSHEVAFAYDGTTAIEKVEQWHPDVVLLDIGLPGLNGYEVARHIRQMPQGKSVFLVALTGYGQDEDRRKSLEAGFDEHLVKPAPVAALQEIFVHTKL
ncbi:MAG: PAS domain S-box protein [Planctomycetia bacterium]|nr:PAS domain S-box protein [Planctomycetia bacterium]